MWFQCISRPKHCGHYGTLINIYLQYVIIQPFEDDNGTGLVLVLVFATSFVSVLNVIFDKAEPAT
jgi:hypothetical protein